ncbi:ATP-grasp domain-containing protein [Ruthenibacterium lactatiformans]|jgi:biotin carboxylase|uniref:ATP-grasp domain-containing protein n=1 Tax=Ruthenibacterium lactatiformans TaxID=1550024 RepID=UPI002670EBA0|nr:ATP-grasp domain-containing protein [Ruthenibacterium lactatiformans]
MKKVLMLGGSMQQIPAIKRAKEMDYYVITCDYLPENPGHQYADEYHNVSTTDIDKVLELAQKINIDGIVAYASDPAAPTAAYVAEKMGLPGNPYESVKILTQKDLFREFLGKNRFNTPKARGYSSYDEIANEVDEFIFPIMVKPVDSSGSKGVVKVERRSGLKDAVEEALYYSRSKKFVVEEFIEKKGYQVSGDGFSVDGKLVFSSYGNELYSGKGTRDYLALGEFWPSLLTKEQKEKVDAEIQNIITALNMRNCAYNIEVILDKNDTPYVIELGPRNGGSYIPQLIEYSTGVNLIDYTLKAAMGEDCSSLTMAETTGVWSNYMLLSKECGIFDRIEFAPEFEKHNLLEVHCTAKKGDAVEAYKNTSHSLGTILFKAQSVSEMIQITNNIENYYKIVVNSK